VETENGIKYIFETKIHVKTAADSANDLIKCGNCGDTYDKTIAAGRCLKCGADNR
jgi:hypothetical protein